MSYNVSNCWIWHDGTDAIVGRDDARKEFLSVPTNSGEKFRIAAPLNASGRFKSECIGSALNYLFIPQDLMSTDYCAGFLSGWRCDGDSRTTAQFLYSPTKQFGCDLENPVISYSRQYNNTFWVFHGLSWARVCLLVDTYRVTSHILFE